MGKIGDLFVRLGLKSDGFKKGMQDAKKETQSFGDKLKGMKAGAVAVWAAIGAGVVKVSKDFISATNKIGDEWGKTMSNMKSQYHTWLASIANYKPEKGKGILGVIKGDWQWIKDTNARAKEAGAAAAAMTEAFDAEFELTNSLRLQRGAMQEELNELEIMMRDRTLTPEARQAAVDKYKALLAPLTERAADTYKTMMEEAVKGWMGGSGLNRSVSEVVEYFKIAGTEAAKVKFPDLEDWYNNHMGDAQNQPIFDIIAKYQQAAAEASDLDKKLSRVTNSIKGEIEKQMQDLSKWAKGLRIEAMKVEIEPEFEFDTDLEDEIEEYTNQVTQQLISSIQDKQAEVKQLNDMLTNALTQSFTGATQAFTDMLMGIEGADASQVMAAVLQPIANTAIQLGEMLIAEGVAISAFKESLKSLKPEVALAAGASLIAIGAALSSGIKKLGSNGAGGTTASTAQSSTASAQQLEQEITINVVGEISGDKIILAGQKTLNKWSR
jgi:hypothetical protein